MTDQNPNFCCEHCLRLLLFFSWGVYLTLTPLGEVAAVAEAAEPCGLYVVKQPRCFQNVASLLKLLAPHLH